MMLNGAGVYNVCVLSQRHVVWFFFIFSFSINFVIVLYFPEYLLLAHLFIKEKKIQLPILFIDIWFCFTFESHAF